MTANKHRFVIRCSPICMLRPFDTEQANLAQETIIGMGMFKRVHSWDTYKSNQIKSHLLDSGITAVLVYHTFWSLLCLSPHRVEALSDAFV